MLNLAKKLNIEQDIRSPKVFPYNYNYAPLKQIFKSFQGRQCIDNAPWC